MVAAPDGLTTGSQTSRTVDPWQWLTAEVVTAATADSSDKRWLFGAIVVTGETAGFADRRRGFRAVVIATEVRYAAGPAFTRIETSGHRGRRRRGEPADCQHYCERPEVQHGKSFCFALSGRCRGMRSTCVSGKIVTVHCTTLWSHLGTTAETIGPNSFEIAKTQLPLSWSIGESQITCAVYRGALLVSCPFLSSRRQIHQDRQPLRQKMRERVGFGTR